MSAPKSLVTLARKAALAHAHANDCNRRWAEAFAAHYGHSDISDVLVEIIDYSTGDVSQLTGDFIDANSWPGKS